MYELSNPAVSKTSKKILVTRSDIKPIFFLWSDNCGLVQPVTVGRQLDIRECSEHKNVAQAARANYRQLALNILVLATLFNKFESFILP